MKVIRAEKKATRTIPARVMVISMNRVMVRSGVIRGVEEKVFEVFVVGKEDEDGD